MKRAALLIAVLAASSTPPAIAIAQERSVKPDFSKVTSLAKAKRLAAKGELVEILFFPAELGGEQVPQNIGYIPPAAAEARAMIVGTLVRFTHEKVIETLTVTPEYKGESFVPSRIVMHATSKKKGGSFDPTIEIW